jgi:hypothetical protein
MSLRLLPGGPITHISRSRRERARQRSRAMAAHSWNAMITGLLERSGVTRP